jgi:hypothetical protein
MASIYLTTVDIAERTGGNLRQLRLLADAGALQAIPDTQHGGRGVHRLFPQSELTVAAILVALAPFRLPIGALTDIAKIIRSLDRHIATAGWPVEMPHHEKALSWIGEDAAFMMIMAGDPALRAPFRIEFGITPELPPIKGSDTRPTAGIVIDLRATWESLKQ